MSDRQGISQGQNGRESRDLSQIRPELDRIDQQIMALFSRRQRLGREVYAAKRQQGLPVFDPVRESEKIAALENSDDPLIATYGPELMSELMRLSRKEQERLKRQDDAL